MHVKMLTKAAVHYLVRLSNRCLIAARSQIQDSGVCFDSGVLEDCQMLNTTHEKAYKPFERPL